FVLVSRPSALPRLETERFARQLRRLEVPLTALVVNAVTTPSCSRCADAAEREAPEIERLARAPAPTFLAPAIYPAPLGPQALRAWRGTWRRVRGAEARSMT